MAIPDLLKACPLFFELYDKEVERIVRHCNVLNFTVGERIVTDGEIGDQIFVVLEGCAQVQKNIGSQVIRIQSLSVGDVFGEMVLIDERTRSADIVAEGDCHILEISYSDIFNIFKSEPKIFGLIMLNLSRLIARKLRKTNELLSGTQKRSA